MSNFYNVLGRNLKVPTRDGACVYVCVCVCVYVHARVDVCGVVAVWLYACAYLSVSRYDCVACVRACVQVF